MDDTKLHPHDEDHVADIDDPVVRRAFQCLAGRMAANHLVLKSLTQMVGDLERDLKRIGGGPVPSGWDWERLRSLEERVDGVRMRLEGVLELPQPADVRARLDNHHNRICALEGAVDE